MEWLFSWEVTSVVFAVLIGVGFAFLALNDFKLAKLCFLLAAADAIGGILMWGVKTQRPLWQLTILVFIMAGSVGALSVLALRYVDNKREAFQPPPKSTIPELDKKSNDSQVRQSPISKLLRFTTIVPFSETSKNVPIPMDTNFEDPKADFYQDLTGLTIRSDQPPPGTVYKERKLDTLNDKFIFVTRLIQYYILHSIRISQKGRQGTKFALGKGVSVVDVSPIPPPDAVPYPTADLIQTLGNNDFLNQTELFLWKTRLFELPLNTTIRLEDEPSNGPLEYAVYLERPGYYYIKFVASPSISMAGQPPAGFQSTDSSVSSYPVMIVMNYEIQRRSDDNFQPEIYSQWAEDLFSGLKAFMAP